MKTLVIVAHPKIDNSTTEQFFYQGAQLVQANWHHLDTLDRINIEHEQQLLLQAQRIIFQFPLYWYQAPASLSQWQTQVLSNQFLNNSLRDKELGIVVTTGLPAKAFQAGGQVGYSLGQLMTPFQALARQAQMQFLPIFPVYQFYYLSEIEQLQLFMDYQRYLSQDFPDSLKNRSQWYLHYLQKQQNRKNATQDLIIQTFTQMTDELNSAQATLDLIKQDEDDTFE
ncbi:NAD(P)H-dependent oxidoreductase [Bombilactobacillus mellis]|uniref:NAD(P)H-dependent oxidoreductase n=1 Tax=Bombilactobacillus mellis TaxID=1218508 RepID=UPI0005F89B7D